MKKKIFLILAIVLTTVVAVYAVVLIVIDRASPWTLMYLYGKFGVEEPNKPLITEEIFPFTLVYELNGKRIIIEDKMLCKYTGSEWYGQEEGKSRTWAMELESGGDSIVLWEGKNSQGERQRIIGGVEPEYYMDDVNDDYIYELPDKDDFLYPGMTEEEYRNSYIILETIDSDGGIEEDAIVTKRALSKYGINILSWKCRSPIKNSFD